MGTGGKTFNAHVLSATYHHKHVRSMAGDDSDLRRGIGELLGRWGGLQMAVKNKWGGHDSLEKSQELAHDLFHLLSQPNVITVDEIESFLHESLLLSFNTEMEDGSIEEELCNKRSKQHIPVFTDILDESSESSETLLEKKKIVEVFLRDHITLGFAVSGCVSSSHFYCNDTTDIPTIEMVLCPPASGLICGDGIWTTPSEILSILRTNPPI